MWSLGCWGCVFVPMFSSACGCREHLVVFCSCFLVISGPGDVSSEE